MKNEATKRYTAAQEAEMFKARVDALYAGGLSWTAFDGGQREQWDRIQRTRSARFFEQVARLTTPIGRV